LERRFKGMLLLKDVEGFGARVLRRLVWGDGGSVGISGEESSTNIRISTGTHQNRHPIKSYTFVIDDMYKDNSGPMHMLS